MAFTSVPNDFRDVVLVSLGSLLHKLGYLDEALKAASEALAKNSVEVRSLKMEVVCSTETLVTRLHGIVSQKITTNVLCIFSSSMALWPVFGPWPPQPSSSALRGFYMFVLDKLLFKVNNQLYISVCLHKI
jgi:hypothetical protein